MFELAKSFHEEGHEIFILSGQDGWLTDKAMSVGIKVFFSKKIKNGYSPVGLLEGYFDVLKITKNINPDIIHGHSSIAGLISRAVAQKLKKKSFYTAHGVPYSPGYPLKHRLLSAAAEFCINAFTSTNIIYVSKKDLYLSEKFNVAPLDPIRKHVIYNGISALKKRSDKKFKTLKVVMAARFQYPKDHRTIVETARLLKNENVEFHLVGDGPGKSAIENLVKEYHLENVFFHGAIPDFKDHLHNYDLFFLTSYSEGLPVSLIEAMSAGLPVIASNVGGIPEIITEDVGFLIGTSDYVTCSNIIRRFLTDTDLAIKSYNANNRFKLTFHKDYMLESVKRLYYKSLITY